MQTKAELEHAKAFGQSVLTCVLHRVQTPAAERPRPVLAPVACRDDESRVSCGTRLRQSQHPREHTSDRVVAAFDANIAVRANNRAYGVQASERLRKLMPGSTQDSRVQRCSGRRRLAIEVYFRTHVSVVFVGLPPL